MHVRDGQIHSAEASRSTQHVTFKNLKWTSGALAFRPSAGMIRPTAVVSPYIVPIASRGIPAPRRPVEAACQGMLTSLADDTD